MFRIGRLSGMPLPALDHHQPAAGPRLSPREGLCLLFLFSRVLCSLLSAPETQVFAIKVIVMSTGVYVFFGLFDGLFFYAGGRELVSVVDGLDGVNRQILELGQSEGFLREYEEAGRKMQRLADLLGVVTLVCAVSFATSTPVLDYLAGSYGSYPWALKAQCRPAQALDKHRWLFELIVLEEIMSYLIPGNFKSLTDCIMISLMKIQSLHYSHLSHLLHVMPMATDKGSLLRWLKIHREVVLYAIHRLLAAFKNFQKLVRFFSPLLVVYSMGTITMIAGILIYLVQAETPNVIQSISGSAYMCLSMLQLFQMANATDQVNDVSEKIAFDMYSIPWYEMRTEERHYVRMVINIANYRVYVEGFKAQSFRINRETYLKIFMSTVSAYIGLKKLIEINDSGFKKD